MKTSPVLKYALAGCLILPASTFASENNSESVFSPLTVSGNTQIDNIGSSAATYHQPGAYSSRDITNSNLQNLDDTFRDMPGSYTEYDALQGTVDVNIRGMSGLGRVNTMVDGVTQTYFGQAPASSYHCCANNDSGVLIDKNFLAGVDITRGSSAGAQGINALAGSANMRTIGVDDVLTHDHKVGILSRFSVGNNGLGQSGMLAVAGKTSIFSHGGSIGALIGISGNRIYATYKNGSGRSSKDFIGNDNQYLRQTPHSQLYKLYFNPDQYNKLEFAGRNYENVLTQRHISSADYYLKYTFTPPSELIDVSVLASNSQAKQDYQPESMYNFNNASLKNRSNALNINNTSRFTALGVDFAWLFGGKIMNTHFTRAFTQDDVTESNAFAPAGIQKISALYTGLTLNKSIYQLDMDLNYTHSQVSGFKPACDDDVKCFPQGASTIHLNDTSLNPSLILSAQVTPWLQPFVSWSRSTRAPNIQEVFFANEGGASMNPFLKPERADTKQIGFNIDKKGLLTDTDVFRLKALAYQSRIKDYISGQTFFVCEQGLLCQDFDRTENYGFNAQISVNNTKPVTNSGYEIEGMYDAGFAFLNISYSKQHTDQPTSVTSNTEGGFGYGDFSDLPDSYASVNVGTRLLDQKLVIGSIIKFTGKTKRLDPDGIDIDTGTLKKDDMPNIPTIFDIYSSYQVTKNIRLGLGVQNVGNKDYAAALNRMNQSIDNAVEGESINTTARGRTWVFNGTIRF